MQGSKVMFKFNISQQECTLIQVYKRFLGSNLMSKVEILLHNSPSYLCAKKCIDYGEQELLVLMLNYI